MNKCEVCGYLHYRTDPCRVAKKSTDDRKAERIVPRMSAKITSMPVDTNPAPLSLAAANPTRLGSDTRKDSGMGGAGAKFDKAAWMRARMPEYMRQYRAEVKSGLRVPKPRPAVPS